MTYYKIEEIDAGLAKKKVLKKYHAEKNNGSDPEIITVTNLYFAGLGESGFKDRIQAPKYV